MMEKAKACELFDTSGKNVNHFKVTTYGGHDIEGWICKSRGTKMGSLIIETVDGKETLQYVQGMPKIKYYDSRDKIGYNINTAFQHFWIDNEGEEYGVTPSMAFNEWYGSYFDMNKIDDTYFPNIYELYKSLESIYERINMAYQKDHPGIIIEGSVWHYGDTENHLIKNKALSVREGHIKQACGIPHHDIRKAIIKTDESYDGELREATTPYIINNVNDELLEEYESSMVYDKKTEDKIKAVLGKYLRKVEVTEELSSIVSQLREECGADADPSDMMRYYSQLPVYNKNLVGKVYQTIVSMS